MLRNPTGSGWASSSNEPPIVALGLLGGSGRFKDTATNILAQTRFGTAGDTGVALALDPSGNLYIAGTTTSGAITATSNAAFPVPTGSSTNAFIGKFGFRQRAGENRL